jgi:hypothetical protein
MEAFFINALLRHRQGVFLQVQIMIAAAIMQASNMEVVKMSKIIGTNSFPR